MRCRQQLPSQRGNAQPLRYPAVVQRVVAVWHHRDESALVQHSKALHLVDAFVHDTVS